MAEINENNERIIEVPRYSLFGRPLPNSNRSPRLAWCCYKGNPRITVFLNASDNLPNKGIISAPMDPTTMETLLRHIKKAVTAEPGFTAEVKCLTNNRDTNNTSVASEKILLSTVVVKKNEQGVISIALIAPNMPEALFDFTISDYHEISINGQPETAASASANKALSVADGLLKIYPIMIEKTDPASLRVNTTASPAPQASKKEISSFDDDITF